MTCETARVESVSAARNSSRTWRAPALGIRSVPPQERVHHSPASEGSKVIGETSRNRSTLSG
ncbi:hypothetical protein SAMN05661093_06446 [Kibdelosporangium aridum]|uniref:Uncharacterized protein n=1 Tax=Kibdelosporangium aridum TaxID=2030 RepID=A0A1Y5XZM1_KIBAR|nr:hypothetical protein SAMN05661093_06446 [Kibdelosporangium aridum]